LVLDSCQSFLSKKIHIASSQEIKDQQVAA